MASIVINGVSISGGNVTIKNNRVMVDGKDVTPDAKEINISVTGDVDQIKVDACQKIPISGNAGSVECHAGSIEVGGNVAGSVKTHAGSIRCGDVGGDASTIAGHVSRR